MTMQANRNAAEKILTSGSLKEKCRTGAGRADLAFDARATGFRSGTLSLIATTNECAEKLLNRLVETTAFLGLDAVSGRHTSPLLSG